MAGQGRRTTSDFVHHLSVARGSLFELETQVVISERLTYFERDVASELLERVAEVGKLLNGLVNALVKKRQ